MKTFFNKTQRSVTTEFPLTGEPLDGFNGAPTLKLRVSHYAAAKALTASVSYIEKDVSAGYTMEKWQSDWPMIRVASKPVSRYSQKALLTFAEETLRALTYGAYDDNETIAALRDRVITEEVAA
jgi:hypothetical protein